MTEIDFVLNYKSRRLADISELINGYIDHMDEIISDEELLKISKPLMQEGQKTPFLLFIKDARLKIRKDLINDVSDFMSKYEVPPLFDKIAQYCLNSEIITKLQESGIDKYTGD